MDIAKWVKDAHAQATKSGFWDCSCPPLTLESERARQRNHQLHLDSCQHNLLMKVVWIHTEISEAFEEYCATDERRGGPLSALLYENVCGEVVGDPIRRSMAAKTEHCDDWSKCHHKPAGFIVELADVCLRTFDLTGYLGLDRELDATLVQRWQMTQTRSGGWGERFCKLHGRATALGDLMMHGAKRQRGLP